MTGEREIQELMQKGLQDLRMMKVGSSAAAHAVLDFAVALEITRKKCTNHSSHYLRDKPS